MEKKGKKPGQYKSKTMTEIDSSPETRRHSIGCGDRRDRSILHSASDTRLPLRILARSMVTGNSSSSIMPTSQISSIDIKFIQMYVKKIGPEYRQNSDPTFNCHQRRQRSIDCNNATAPNSGQSSSRASSNDDFPPSAFPAKSPDHKSIIVAPMGGKLKALPKIVRRWASGSDLKESAEKVDPDPISSDYDSSSEQVVTCYRILESIFAGGLDAATNSALLCRLKIDHVIDLRSAVDGSKSGKIGQNRAMSVNCIRSESQFSCVCPDSCHKREPVNLRIPDSKSIKDLMEGFDRLNAFITKARVKGERILLFDEDGRGMAPAAVIEYLIYYYHMTYLAAKAFVSEIIPDMEIPDNVESGLIKWRADLENKSTGQRCATSCGFPESQKEKGIPMIIKKKDAWM